MTDKPNNPLMPPAEEAGAEPADELKQEVIDVLCTIFDPEIPVNIWELGLIYDVNVDESKNVHIRMTLTTPACPVAGTLPPEVEQRVRTVSGVNEVVVELVWDPPWDKDKLSEAAKLQMGLL